MDVAEVATDAQNKKVIGAGAAREVVDEGGIILQNPGVQCARGVPRAVASGIGVFGVEHGEDAEVSALHTGGADDMLEGAGGVAVVHQALQRAIEDFNGGCSSLHRVLKTPAFISSSFNKNLQGVRNTHSSDA